MKPVLRRLPRLGVWGLVALAVAAIPFAVSSYLTYMLTLTAIYYIIAVGMVLLTGFARQVSIGHAGLLAIGAYTSGLLTARLGLPMPVAFVASGVLTGAFGFVIGLPATRLSGPYLALATLGFGVAVPQVLLRWQSLSGGAMGLHVPRLVVPGMAALTTDAQAYYVALITAAACAFVTRNLLTGITGRAWRALGQGELAAQAAGITLAGYKTAAFAISALFTGLAGSLYAHTVGFIAPESFTVFQSMQFLAIIVLGGTGSLAGAVGGTLLVVLVPQVASHVKGLPALIYGLLLVVTLMFAPGGLAGIWRSLGWLTDRATAAPGAGGTGRGG